MTRALSAAQMRAARAHDEYRANGYRSIPIRLKVITDSRGARKKRPVFPGGSWQAAETIDVAEAIRVGFTDVAIVCSNVASFDFDPRRGEKEADVLARCRTVYKTWKLDGAVVERSGHGYHIITRAPGGEWSRRIWGAPHPICEVRCGRDTAGAGLLLFVFPTWHPIELRFYERLTQLVAVDALPECPRELLEQSVTKLSIPTLQPRNVTGRGDGGGDWRTLDVVALFRNAGMYRGELRAKAGMSARHSVQCPWESEHTGGGDGTDVVVFEKTAAHAPLFRCLHQHCAERTMRDVREYFGADVVDRFCSREFEPQRRFGDTWTRPARWWQSTEAHA